MPTKDRQRALARAKLERQLARKAASTRKRRRIWAGVASVAVLAALTAGIVYMVKKYGPAGSEKASGPVCSYQNAALDKDRMKNVGRPSTENIPDSGTRTATLHTNFGNISVALDQKAAPCTVHSFLYLAQKGFYNKTICHRLTTSGIMVMQCGDPTANGNPESDGTGGASYQFGQENTPVGQSQPLYPVGTVAMAHGANDTNSGSQFFIVYGDSSLDNSYSILGHVSSGLDTITKKIVPNGVTEQKPGTGDGEPKKTVTISKVTD